jgi:hypothetical protein
MKLRISSIIQGVLPAGECLHLYIYRDDVDEGIGTGQSVVALFGRRELDIVAVCWCSLVLFLLNCRKRHFNIAHVAWRLCNCVMNGQKSYGLDKSVRSSWTKWIHRDADTSCDCVQ